LQQSLSYSSSCLSASEFFDAQEFQSNLVISETSSEASLSSEEGSVVSENSEVGTDNTPAQSSKLFSFIICEKLLIIKLF